MKEEYRIKVPDTVHRMTAVYHAIGLWHTGNGKISLLQAAYLIFLSTFVLSTFVKFWASEQMDNDIFQLVLTLAGGLQAYRLNFVMRKQNQILDFMERIFVNSTDDYEIFCKTDKKIKKFVTFAQFFICILCILCGVVVCVPLVKKQLIFDIAFSSDYKTNASAFWMGYASVVGAYVLSVTIFMFVILMWYIMLIFVVKYDLLASQLRKLGEMREENSNEKLANNFTSDIVKKCLNHSSKGEGSSYDRNLVEAIKRQKTINGQLDEFETMFSSVFLLQIISSSMCICGSTFALAFRTHDDFFQDAFYFVEIIYCLGDIFAVLYLANEIMLSTDRLSYSLFESNWIDQTQSCKKYMLIVVEYLKHPRMFIVGKLFPMSLETFIMIGRRSYSMFNILRNFHQ